jgi:D-threo-aldose 1-dehydrogenase
MRHLAGTEVTTTVLGFGCSGIFRVPSARRRRELLETAREVGIRHFDVAPMYGLGRAEAELAPILAADRAHLTVTTKFGLEPTAFGRATGRVQRPMRAVLSRRRELQNHLMRSARSPASGVLGRVLYAAAATPATAREGLRRSLSALRTDHLDVFAVHEPADTVVAQPDALADCLDQMQADGTIRCWAVAGELPDAGSAAALVARGPVVQRHDDVFGPLPDARRASITYGAISRALPVVVSYLRREPQAVGVWSERLQADLTDPATLPALLLRHAIRRNPTGVVLFSTTRPPRIRAAAAAVVAASPGPAAAAEGQAMEGLVAAVTGAGGAVNDS